MGTLVALGAVGQQDCPPGFAKVTSSISSCPPIIIIEVIWDDKSGLYPALGQLCHVGAQGRHDLLLLDTGPAGLHHPETR